MKIALIYSFAYWATTLSSLYFFLNFPATRIGGVALNGLFQLFGPALGLVVHIVFLVILVANRKLSKEAAFSIALVSFCVSTFAYFRTFPIFMGA